MSLALPPGGRDRPAHLLGTGVLVGAAGGATMVGALIAAYVNLRSLAPAWPPKGVRTDTYLGAILLITLLLSAALVEWAPAALRRAQDRQTKAALALTALLGLAFVNGAWYTGSQFRFGADDHAYATLAYAMVGLCGVFAAVGVIALLAALAKVAGRQVGPRDGDVVRAAAWYWQFVVVSWLAVYSTLFLFK